MSHESEKMRSRIFYLDFIRMFACLSVVMIHASARFATSTVGSLSFWTGHLFDTISRTGVPLFVMVSGALMLDEQYDYSKKKLLRHIYKMVSFFLFWSIGYSFTFNVLAPIVKNKPILFQKTIWGILKGPYHFWFIPMIIGVYLIVPLLRLWVCKTNIKYVSYFLILFLIFGSILPLVLKLAKLLYPEMNQLDELITNIHMYYPVGYTAYFVLGWYLNQANINLKKSWIYGLGLFSILVTFIGSYILYAFFDDHAFVLYDYFAPNILLYAASIFLFGRSAFTQPPARNSRFSRFVNLICKYSMGIYAIHAAVNTGFVLFCPPMNPIIAIPMIFFLCTLLSICVSYVMMKIPFLRQFI